MSLQITYLKSRRLADQVGGGDCDCSMVGIRGRASKPARQFGHRALQGIHLYWPANHSSREQEDIISTDCQSFADCLCRNQTILVALVSSGCICLPSIDEDL